MTLWEGYGDILLVHFNIYTIMYKTDLVREKGLELREQKMCDIEAQKAYPSLGATLQIHVSIFVSVMRE